MFSKTRLPFAAAAKLGNEFMVKSRSLHLVVATFLTVLLLTLPAPAWAATDDGGATAPNFMCFVGTPSLEVFTPAQQASREVTSIILGVVIALSFIGAVIGTVRIIMAGKHTDKSADGVKQISNALIGVTALLGVLLVLGILVSVLVGIVPFGC